jgi:hypothetical protein
LGGDLVGGVLGLPEDLEDVPVLSVVDGLDRVDAAREGLAGQGGGVGAPEMGDVAEGFGLIFNLVFGDDFVAVFGDGCDPVIDGEDARAVGADGNEARGGQQKLLHAGAVFVCGAGDSGVEGDDELVEGGGGWTGCGSWGGGLRWGRRLGWGLGLGCEAGP